MKKSKPVITSIRVDLGAFPKKIGDNFSVKDHHGTGIVTLEKRANELYLDSRKLILTQSNRQKDGRTIQGYDLKKEATDQPVLNANVLDALLAKPELFPDNWKIDRRGRTRYIAFWGTIYQNNNMCVRCVHFGAGRWIDDHSWLSHWWGGQDWSVVFES